VPGMVIRCSERSLTKWQLVSIKKFVLKWVRIDPIFSKTAMSLYLKDLIFTGKLEMVIGSMFRSKQSGRRIPKEFLL